MERIILIVLMFFAMAVRLAITIIRFVNNRNDNHKPVLSMNRIAAHYQLVRHKNGAKREWVDEARKIRFSMDLRLTGRVSFTAMYNNRLPVMMKIRPAYINGVSQNIIGMKSHTTGDEVFDDMMLVTTNNTEYLHGYLRYPARHLFIELANGMSQFIISEQGITCSAVAEDSTISNLRHLFINTAQKLQREFYNHKMESSIQGMVSIILHDPIEAVRRQCYEYFSRTYFIANEHTELLQKFLSSSDVWIRLESACRIGMQAGEEHIIDVLKRGSKENIPIAAEKAGRISSTKCIPHLMDAYEGQDDIYVKQVILEAFRAIKNTGVSDYLVKKLAVEDKRLAEQILYTLGVCGTLEAVEPMYVFYRKTFGLPGGIIKQAKEAIAAIQNREAEGNKGWVSLAEHQSENGNLTVIDDSTENEYL